MFWNNSKAESTDTSKTINGLTMTMTMALFDVKEASLWSIMVAALPLILLTWLILVLLKKVSKKNFSVQGSNIVITGASRGIGRQIALQYSAANARLVISATNKRLLESVAEECRNAGAADVFVFSQRLGGRDSAAALRNFSQEKLGRVDTLILNHVLLPSLNGNSHWKEEKDFDDLESKTLVNYMSYVYIASSFRNLLEASCGKICIVSSIAALVPMFKSNTYAATKAALNAFFLSYREELLERRSNITISQVFLGLVTTESITNAIGKFMSNVTSITNNVVFRQFVLPPKVAARRVIEAVETRTETTYCPKKTIFTLRLLYFLFSDYFLKFFRVIHQESEKQISADSD